MRIPQKQAAGEQGFTLLEIILAVAILSALMVGVTLIVNPAERLRQARDAQRLSDVRALADAVAVMESDITGGVADFDYDGPLFAGDDSCAGQGNPRIFVSVPADNGETPPDPPTGWTYAQVNAASLYDIAGNGWVPVDFTQNTNAPLTALPADPTNTFASGLYYSYVCGASFEVNAALESTEFITNATDDGGDEANLFEVGSGLTSAPERPATVNEGVGGSATNTTLVLSGNTPLDPGAERCAPPTSPTFPSWNVDEEPATLDSELVNCTADSQPTEEYVWLSGFGLSSVTGAIDGIVVLLDDVSVESSVPGVQELRVRLSWDGGTNWTTGDCRTGDVIDQTLAGTDYWCFGPETATTDSMTGTHSGWGRTWVPSDLQPGNFVVEVGAHSDNGTAYFVRFDTVQVDVHYTP